ncbi:MAG: hypothetical protein V4556_06650 [Bacteroidota bacterium]
MSKYLMFIIGVGALFFASCKKTTIAADPNCPLDSAHVIGKYKISSIKVKIVGAETDVTDRFDACAVDDTMNILPRNVYENIDKGTPSTCNNDYSGNWDLVDSTLWIDATEYKVVGFNCNSIALAKDSSGFKFKFYYNRY